MQKSLGTLFGTVTLAGVAFSAPAVAAQITVDNVGVTKVGVGYVPSPPPAGCNPSPLGGFDGFDCGLNLVTTSSVPGLATVPGPTPLGTALLAERNLVAFGTFPKGDGNSLADFELDVSFSVNGTPLTFKGNATDFVGDGIGSDFGLPSASTPDGATARTNFCNNPSNWSKAPGCVNDSAMDFRIAFSGPQSLTLGSDTFTFSLSSLEFYNNSTAVPIVLTTSVQSSPPTGVPEPGTIALLTAGLAGLAWGYRRDIRGGGKG